MTVVLGMDSATADAVVAVSDGERLLRDASVGPDDGRPRHAELLLTEVERSVAAAGGWEHIDRIAVGVGPGSFTGLRIGIATARALAQARELPLVPVSSLAALARGIAEPRDAGGWPQLRHCSDGPDHPVLSRSQELLRFFSRCSSSHR